MLQPDLRPSRQASRAGNGERHGAFWEYASNDVVHATSKKYFTHGLWPGVLIPLYWAATGVIRGEPPTPDRVLGIVERERMTKLITVPTIVKNLIFHVESNHIRPDFPSVWLVVTGSEKMSQEILPSFASCSGQNCTTPSAVRK